VDLADATCELEGVEINTLVSTLASDVWPAGNKVVLVSGPGLEDYHRLYSLRVALTTHGLYAAVFRDSKVAIDGLAGRI
jgi:hypothetical protein